MKSQKECYDALSAGKTLVNKDSEKVKLDENGNQTSKYAYPFSYPEDWEIYEPTYTEQQIREAYDIAWMRCGGRPPNINEILEQLTKAEK